jgi:hypothetical protein
MRGARRWGGQRWQESVVARPGSGGASKKMKLNDEAHMSAVGRKATRHSDASLWRRHKLEGHQCGM